jgi:hypothetical protein
MIAGSYVPPSSRATLISWKAWVARVFDRALKALLLTGLEVALIQNYMNRCSLNGVNS